ncbi:signal peptidase II [Thermosulfurimonas marina]|uniref:Lipoprotein signal peptidase n=1 Tax=Thermosulfurimonas marina TaxID=2047767 RepID=A0A6H1WS68_9BACT|nr:signal peptidase II [Thermosulfurimonas marina]QJA06067.1 signal peptidase II [Thermosulfurimonas marina]
MIPLLAFAVAALDLLTKYLLDRGLPPEGLPLIPGFLSLVKVRNQGIAFGLFREASLGLFWTLAGLAVAGLILWLGRTEKDRGKRVALGLIAGGALGNGIDRLWHGAVFDFVDLHLGPYHWPAFNLADAAIVLGLLLYLLRWKA